MSAVTHPARLGLIAGCALALVGAGALSGCGTEGGLERPAPLFGSAAKRQYQADKAAGRASGTTDTDASSSRRSYGSTDSSGTSSSEDNAPKTTRDIQDPAQKLTPLSTQPVDGPPNPLGPPISTRPPG